MNAIIETKKISLNVAKNILFSSDYYADFVPQFIKWFQNKEQTKTYKILEKSYNGYVVKDERNITMGYVTYMLSPELHEKYMMNPKTMRFFLQPSAFAYAQIEGVKASLEGHFENILKENNAYVTHKEMGEIINNTIFVLIDDFIL